MTITRILAVPSVALGVLLGVWITGGMLTDDFGASVVLTGLWFAAAGAVSVIVASRNRGLRWPVLGTYAVTAAVVSVWLGASTLRDRVVDETLARGVQQASGVFRSGAHATSGRAAVVRVAGGERVLTLEDFETDAGPDLRVRVVPGDTQDGAAGGSIDLGALKGNRGDQQYRIPDGVAVEGRSVVIWCRAFSVSFGTADLRRS